MRIVAEETMALAIDYQEKLIPAMKNKDETLKNSALLLKGLRTLHVPITVTQQYTQGMGGTVAEIAEAAGEFTPMDKTTFSGYENEAIRAKIDSSGKENIILCGAEAHVCVLQTLIDLRDADYQVILVTDCIASRKDKDKEAAIQRAMHEGAIVTTYEQILFELTRKSTMPRFKEMLRLIK